MADITIEEILKNSFVITNGGVRLEQFNRTFNAVGLDSSLIRQWRACMIPGEGILGHAVAMYSCVRYAQEQKMPFVLVFEDDVVPSDKAKQELLDAFEKKPNDCVCLSLGWSYDSDPQPDKEFSLRSDRRRVYGLNAVVLFGNEGYETFLKEWEKNGRSDIVVSNFVGSYMTNKSSFTQHTVGGSMNLPPGWTLDRKIEQIVDKEASDRYSKAVAEIEKQKAENTIHIAYAIDVKGPGAFQFCDQLIVSLYSLLRTKNPDDNLMVHIFYNQIPSDTIVSCQKFERDDFKISFKKIPDNLIALFEKMTGRNPAGITRVFCGITLTRFWLPILLQPTVKKVIYMDADTLCRAPISILWNIDLKDNLIAAPKGIIHEYGFYSGTIVLNLEGMRKEKELSVENFGKFCLENSAKFYLPDQTSMNKFFAGRILQIDSGWIYPPTVGANDSGLETAPMWHFYNSSKPTRIDKDDYGKALLVWNKALNDAKAFINSKMYK